MARNDSRAGIMRGAGSDLADMPVYMRDLFITVNDAAAEHKTGSSCSGTFRDEGNIPSR